MQKMLSRYYDIKSEAQRELTEVFGHGEPVGGHSTGPGPGLGNRLEQKGCSGWKIQGSGRAETGC